MSDRHAFNAYDIAEYWAAKFKGTAPKLQSVVRSQFLQALIRFAEQGETDRCDDIVTLMHQNHPETREMVWPEECGEAITFLRIPTRASFTVR